MKDYRVLQVMGYTPVDDFSVVKVGDEWEIGEWRSSKNRPTNEEIASAEADYDAQAYARSRAAAYPSIQEQLDMQYWDSVNGTTTWADAIAAVKAAHPKGE